MSLIENIKSVASTVQQIDNIELYSKILDVQGEAMNLMEDNRELKSKIHLLEDQLKIKQKVYFDRNSSWYREDDKIVGPFCSNCSDVKGILVRLHSTSLPESMFCPSCQIHVEVYPEKAHPYVQTDEQFYP